MIEGFKDKNIVQLNLESYLAAYNLTHIPRNYYINFKRISKDGTTEIDELATMKRNFGKITGHKTSKIVLYFPKSGGPEKEVFRDPLGMGILAHGWTASPEVFEKGENKLPVDMLNALYDIGIVYIISGVLSALTIIGIIVAWLPIWMGVLLYQAGDRAVFAHMQNNPAELDSMMSKFKTYFTILGIIMIIGLFFTFISIILLIGGGFALYDILNF